MAVAPEALAQEGSAPNIDLVNQDSGPPPVSLQKRTFHVHEGFYLRLNLGIGGMRVAVNEDGRDDVVGGGAASAFDVLIGGSPTRGLAIGGGLFLTGAVGADFEVDDGPNLPDRNVGVAMLGFFIDGFPNPKKGWHIGGAIGPAAVDIEEDSRTTSARGAGGFAWVGHQWWVAPEWSLGLKLRLGATVTAAEDDNTGADVTVGTWSTTLMFTALLH